jgi:hydrogenase/urease accessory protein HupE
MAVSSAAVSLRAQRSTLCFSALLGMTFWLLPLNTIAHESRPAYLQLTEYTPGRYEIVWRRPAVGNQVLVLTPQFPAGCRNLTTRSVSSAVGSLIESWILTCEDAALTGNPIKIEGLSRTITDVLVRVSLLEGVTETYIVRAHTPYFVVRGTPSPWQVARSYATLGVDHILSGVDHLLFVLGLFLLVHGRWVLLKTITAFTVAHSLTLGVATLGFVAVPQAPVEAVIALSILFLAVELAKQRTHKSSLTARCPWGIAFGFGLLHGFGFAGALAEVGLPPTDIPLALLLFNVGVEFGQVLFIVGLLITAAVLQRWELTSPQRWRSAAAYGIGSVSAFWVMQRVAAFF